MFGNQLSVNLLFINLQFVNKLGLLKRSVAATAFFPTRPLFQDSSHIRILSGSLDSRRTVCPCVRLPTHVIICEGYRQECQGHLVQNGVYLCAPHALGMSGANVRG